MYPWEELLEKTVANKKSKNQDQLNKSLPPPVNCAPNNNDWLANLSHVPPNVPDSTEKNTFLKLYANGDWPLFALY